MIKRGAEEFSGYNKPKKTPSHPKKSHAVLAKSGDEVKLIRFGQQGVSGSPDGTKRNEAFRFFFMEGPKSLHGLQDRPSSEI
jgi:hypothetical protein